MAVIYAQTATVAPAGALVACSGAVLIGGGQEQECLCTVGGTAGGAVVVGGSQFDAGAGQAGVMFEIAPTNTIWAAGSWTFRLNVTTANATVTWTDTYICRLNSANVSQATIGSLTGQTTSLSTTGVKTHTVTGAAQTPAASDKVYIVLVFNCTGANQTLGVTFNQNIDSPFEVPTPLAPTFSDPAENLADGFTRLIGDRLIGVVDLDALPLADAAASQLGTPGAAITKTFSDNLNAWADQLNVRYTIAVALSDNLNSWVDSLGARMTIAAAISDSALNVNDQVAVTTTGFQALTVSVTDNLNAWIDSFAGRQTQSVTFTDSAANLADTAVRLVDDRLLLIPDAWQNLADSCAFSLAAPPPNITRNFPPPWATLADGFTRLIGDRVVSIPDTWA